MKYEMLREIFNQCSGNQMRDVFVNEIEAASPEEAVKDYLVGKDVSVERSVRDDGDVVFDCVVDGLHQRYSFTKI